MPRRWAFGAGIVGWMLMAGGCGGSPELAVTMTDFAFEPNSISIKAREKTVLVLQNKGSVEHDLTIPQLNLTSGSIAPGKTGRIEVVVRGPLKIICSIPGHEEAGMVGEIAVQTPARR